MYCRKCMIEAEKEGKENKVNMNIDFENQCYSCPECGHVVEWGKKQEEQ